MSTGGVGIRKKYYGPFKLTFRRSLNEVHAEIFVLRYPPSCQ